MTDAYTEMTMLLLVAVAVPAWVLVWLLKPKPFKLVLRGNEGSVCLAIALGVTWRLVIVISGTKVEYPGDILGMFSLVIFAVVILLLCSRIAKIYRHRTGNNEFRHQLKSSLESRGVNVDKLIEDQENTKGRA